MKRLNPQYTEKVRRVTIPIENDEYLEIVHSKDANAMITIYGIEENYVLDISTCIQLIAQLAIIVERATAFQHGGYDA